MRNLDMTAMLCTLLLTSTATSLWAAWQPNGIPVAPVGTEIEQDIPNLCTDGAGGAYVIWREISSADRGNGYLQRVTSDGEIAPGWPLRGTRVGSHPNSEFICNLAPDLAGGVYVVWRTSLASGLEYRLLRFLSGGTIAPGWPSEGLFLPVGSPFDRMDALCGDGAGGIFIVWTSTDIDVYMLHYTGSGDVAPGWSSLGRRIIAEPSTKASARLLPTLEGGILASWNDSRGGVGLGIGRYALKLAPSGDPAPGWPSGGVLLNSVPTVIDNVFMISDGAGGAFVGWDDNRNGVSPPNPLDYDIYAQHVLGNGTLDSRWPADGLPIVIAPSAQYFFEMAEDGKGGAIFVWDDYRSGPHIYAVHIRPDGSVAPGWTPNGSPMAPRPDAQTIPQAVADFDGGVFGFWDESTIIVAQHLGGDGTPFLDWPSNGRVVAGGDGASYGGPPGAISDGKGGALAVYTRRTGPPVRLSNIYLQRVYGDVPTSTRIALLDVQASPGGVRLRWSVAEATALRAAVYRHPDGEQWTRVGEPTPVGQSTLEFEDRGLSAGRYCYRLGVVDNGTETFTDDVWVDVPSAFSLALTGFRPNPAIRAPSVAFTLPDDRAAQVAVFDVKGRLVSVHDVGGLGAGSHVLPLGGQASWDAGVYWVRLTHSNRTFTSRGVVTR